MHSRDGTLPKAVHLAAAPLDDPVSSTRMPETWVRATMLVRAISLSKGASGVRPHIINALLALLNKDIIPVVPLRGSISASGDLSPLSYIGGVMQGKPVLKASIGTKASGARLFKTADKALQEAGIAPIDVGPKEGLAIVNGTAPSAGVAALILHEVLGLALISQALTAASVEATCGSRESFFKFFAEVRPHDGQRESAQNIWWFLAGSRLATDHDDAEDSLRQDRYSTRTASQWLGPVLEDLGLACRQIEIEINSVTDNPILDNQGMIFHGGNFQAKAVTSAMEKTRQGCQSIGQMIFAQCTELINPVTSRGLPPNLVVDEPNESWMWKGTDIYIAALQSELGYLCNPAGSHVQFAEMGNQALNSLALISSRYTLTAVDVLSQLTAAHLVALCQAFDLRALHHEFLESFEPDFYDLVDLYFGTLWLPEKGNVDVQAELWTSFRKVLLKSTQLTSTARFKAAAESLNATLLQSVLPSTEAATAIPSWTLTCIDAASRRYKAASQRCLRAPDATPLLGRASRKLYVFVRRDLGVPFFGEDYIRPAEWEIRNEENETPGPVHQTMGEMMTAVYLAIRSGALYALTVECLRESMDERKS